jgi:hypothetical protein
MNNARRREIDREAADLREALEALDNVRANLENLRDEEQEYLDAMPEGLQQSDRGEVAQAAIERIEEVIDALDSLAAEGLVEALEEAQA